MNIPVNLPVHATLLVAPGCPHCPQVKQVLNDLLAQSNIASLEVVDISTDLERAETFAVRSVPWLKLNNLALQGQHSRDEISYWVQQAGLPEGRQTLFDSLLEVGQLGQVEAMIRKDPSGLSDVLVLLADQERQINVRIGASAVIEGLADSGLLDEAVDEIGLLTRHADAGTRTDACHILSFIHCPSSFKYLEAALDDTHQDVRETARDSLDELNSL